MGDRTGIEWTDATWNPIRGCSRVSEGCRNCYAELVAARFSGPGQAYEGLARRRSNGEPQWTGVVRVIEEHMFDPLRWRRPRRIFTNSMSDLFHEGLSDGNIIRVFAVMMLAEQHQFQVLTKRPARMAELLNRDAIGDDVWFAAQEIVDQQATAYIDVLCKHSERPVWPLPNVWLGTSVEDQDAATIRIHSLLRTPAAVRFLSCEPLLGPIDLTDIGEDTGYRFNALTGDERYPGSVRTGILPSIDWVIPGGESGPHARVCLIQWVRSLVEQCGAASVKCFVKQLGARPYDAVEALLDNGDIRLRDPKGGDPNEWPADLRVREFPAELAHA
jgi:protein gp37